MKIITLCLLFLLVSLNFCYPQINTNWIFTNPSNFGTDFIDMDFINDNSGFAISNGTIVKTTDSGINWNFYADLKLPKFVTPTTIHILNDSILFIGTYNGLIIKCVNKIISLINSDSFSDDLFRTIEFIDQHTGFAGTNKQLYKTIDGGQSWDVIDRFNIKNIYKIKFVNHSTGFATSTLGTIYKTTNSGLNWFKNQFPQSTNVIYDIDMVDQNTGYACGNGGLILKTTDSGNNWFLINSLLSNLIYSINFFDANIGIVVSGENSYYLNSKIELTTDGGLSWSELQSFDKMYFNCVEKLNSKILLGGKVGFLAQIDRQLNFNQITTYQIPLNTQIKGMKFFNENTGYLITDTGFIYKSVNKGINWNKLSSAPEGLKVTSFEFLNESIGFVIGQNQNLSNVIYRTSNAGFNWSLENLNTNNSINKISFVNNQLGYLSSQNGLYKTTNSGITWNLINDSSFITRELKFTGADTGYCILGTSLFKTTNGGYNWIKLMQQSSGNIWLSFLNSSVGYILFDNLNNRFLFKTLNGGINWSIEDITSKTEYVSDFKFFNENNGFILSDKLYKIENPWNILTPIPITQNFRLLNMYIYDENLRFFFNHISGDLKAPVILKSSSEGNVSIQNNNSVIESFTLHQNYPNPFNPSTTIKYNIMNSGIVSLKVFDVLGREVQTLVNEFKTSGTHSVEFNASNLSSGIYFYRLAINEDISNSNKFFDVKKMILIK